MPRTRHSTEPAKRRAARFCGAFLSAMLLLAGGCGKPSDGTAEVSEPPFKARLPENANRQEYSLESEDYGVTRTIINGVRRGSVFYQFATKSFPPEMIKGLEPERIFLGFRQDGAFPDFAKVSGKRLLQVGGYPAMDVDFEGVLRSPADNSRESVRGHARMVLKNNRAALLLLYGKADDVSLRTALAFFDTLEIETD